MQILGKPPNRLAYGLILAVLNAMKLNLGVSGKLGVPETGLRLE